MSSGNSGAGAPGGASGGSGIGGGSGAGGGGSSSGTNANAGRSRLHSPPVELPSSNAQNFFEEAKITKTEEMELRRKFGKFCTKSPASGGEGGEEEVYLTLDNFCRMLQYYECASAQHYESYFHAIDRNHDDKLDFQEFFLGCCAADPSTVHILNSFTGYERSQYIFDFYDTNRSNTLEFDEFARLTADCLSLPCSSSTEEQAIRAQAVEKARDLGALEDSGDGLIQFSCIRFKKFYEYVQNERLRGTSRLFRFYKSIIKSRGSHSRRNQGSSASGGGGGTPAGGASGGSGSGHTPTAAGSHAVEEGTMVASVEEDLSDREDCEWHAHLLDLDSYFDPDGDEPLATMRERPSPPPYVVLPPPAPAPSLRPEAEPPAADARAVARKVLRALNTQHFDGLLPNGAAGGFDSSDAPFEVVTPAQLRCLCTAAIRLLETEDMVLQGLQPPVKVFGALHGQLPDLLSHFKWHQAPVEAVGDILYTTYVFLGDYVDRGSHCLEVLTLLLSLKVAHPHRVALLRGQHENRHLNYHLGLRLECERRLGAIEGFKVFDYLNRFFEHLSLAAVIGGSILALGPGVLPQSLTRFDQLKRYRKPLQLPHTSQPRPANALERLNEQVLLECFTPGPLMPRELGAVREALPEQVKLICSRNDFATVVRSRPVPSKGFAFEAGGRVVSVTSCLNYCDLPAGNDAAVLLIAKEENSSNLVIKPQVITADVAKIYGVLGRPFGGAASSGPPPPLRWPAQPRDATPGRCAPNPTSLVAGGCGDAAASESTALVIYPDRNVMLDSSLALVAFPALGPGRPPGGLMRQVGATSLLGGAVGRTGSSDSPQAAARSKSGDGSELTKFNSAVNSNEDWQLRPNLRGSLPRRSGGSASTKVPQHESHSEAKIRGTSASGRVHADSSMSETAEVGGAIAKASASPAKGALPRNPAAGVGSGSFGASAVAAAAHAAAAATAADGPGGTAHRRGATSPSTDPVRPSLVASGVPAGVPANGGASCPSGGRDPRAVTSVAARNGTGGPKAKDQQRGPSRPPGSVAPSPKVSASSSVGGPRAQQPTRRAGAGEAPGTAVPASPRQSSVGGEEEEPFTGPPTDPRSLLRLLQDSPRLVAGALPPMPAQHLQNARAVEQPLILHLCRIWLESGLSDKDWAQALHMFEGELCDQPRQQPKAGGLPPSIAAATGAGGEEEEQVEGRWTLETFSMWLLKRGRRLRECSQWFRAFDFDQDEMVGVADFLQGLVASAAPRAPQPGSAGGLCASLALFRLLDLEKRQSLDGRDLEAILAEAQVSLADFQLTLPQVAQRATDFEFFRNTIFPKLQGASAFRLRALGSGPPRE